MSRVKAVMPLAPIIAALAFITAIVLRLGMLLAVLLVAASRVNAQSPAEQELQQRLGQLRRNGSVSLAGHMLSDSGLLLAVYEQGSSRPLWDDEKACSDLLRVLREIEFDGLTPDHYQLPLIERLRRAPLTPATTAELELLRTDALIRVAYDLRYGKANPARPKRSGPLHSTDPAADIRRMISSGRLRDEVLALRPAHFVYRGLVVALARLRSVEQAGGWVHIPAGPSVRPDSFDARIPLLRQRLAAEGDLAHETAPRSLRLDATLQRALQSFQHRHGLNTDGVLGPATLAQLNIPVGTRIHQLRVNLERARWVVHDLPDTFVGVNVAGAMVYFIRDANVVFETRAVVGKSYTATPVFRASMHHIELNPSWTVPPGIVGEVLSAIRRDPGYLARENMHVLSKSGRRLNAANIDFTRYTARSFPYVFRQASGPRNPLGRLKFIFPNHYNVYLHDTPSHELFEREQRTFSHGCIRVHQPLQLAALILNDATHWTPDTLRQAIETGVTRTITLPTPVPVLVLYWTAASDLHGELHFYRDVYGRDPALLRALERP